MLFVSQCCQWQHNSVSAVRQDVAVWIPVTVLVIARRWAALQTEAKGIRYSVCESRQNLHYFIRWESKGFCKWWRRAASYHLNHSETFGYEPIWTSSVFPTSSITSSSVWLMWSRQVNHYLVGLNKTAECWFIIWSLYYFIYYLLSCHTSSCLLSVKAIQTAGFALAPYAKLSVSMQKAEHAAQHTDKQIIRLR